MWYVERSMKKKATKTSKKRRIEINIDTELNKYQFLIPLINAANKLLYTIKKINIKVYL